MNIPEPMIVPMTSALVIQMPISLPRRSLIPRPPRRACHDRRELAMPAPPEAVSAADGSRGCEVVLHDRDGRGRIAGGRTVAAASLRLELGDILEVIADHVAAYLA